MSDPRLPAISSDEMMAFNRFCETCEDGEGYDVPNPMMKRLACIGLIRSLGFNRFETTDFGTLVRDAEIDAARARRANSKVSQLPAPQRIEATQPDLDAERKPLPMADISKILDEVMERASKNGANSISMPDEYVSVAHFVCYPEQYGLQSQAAQPPADWVKQLEHLKYRKRELETEVSDLRNTLAAQKVASADLDAALIQAALEAACGICSQWGTGVQIRNTIRALAADPATIAQIIKDAEERSRRCAS